MKPNFKFVFIYLVLMVFGCNEDDLSNPSNYPTDGLVAYFPFNGDWEDEVSPNTIVATPENDPIFDEDRNGNQNSSIYFEGNAQYLNITLAANIISAPNNEATIALWLRNDITAGWHRTLLAEEGTQAIGIETNSVSPSKISINYNYAVEENEDGTLGIGTNLTHPSKVGVWTHLAYTVDAEYLTLFINGQDISSLALGEADDTQLIPILQPYMQFVLGSNYTSEEFWRGNIDELFFYNRALTDDEIEKIYLR